MPVFLMLTSEYTGGTEAKMFVPWVTVVAIPGALIPGSTHTFPGQCSTSSQWLGTEWILGLVGLTSWWLLCFMAQPCIHSYNPRVVIVKAREFFYPLLYYNHSHAQSSYLYI
jgi:hypothetical protein